MVSKITKKYSSIDVLINNAAYQGNNKIRSAGFEKLELGTWNKAINVNLTGIFLIMSSKLVKLCSNKNLEI